MGPGNWGDKRRVLLERMLQQKKGKGKGPMTKTQKHQMTVWQALTALHSQADKDHDGKISDREILDIFQGVRDHLSASDFGGFLDLVNRLHGPVNCKTNSDCGKCTSKANAGLCGWFNESHGKNNNPFGGYQSSKTKGVCRFVDRSQNSEKNKDSSGWRPARLSARKSIASARSKSDVSVVPTQQNNNKKIKCPIILRRTNGILLHLCEYVYRYGFLFWGHQKRVNSYF